MSSTRTTDSTAGTSSSTDDKKIATLGLPANYHFELPKTINRIKEKGAKRVALQFPEGLLLFSVPIADLIEQETGAEVVILGDVTYGACCVDDLAATALGCDFLVHYGHSCLISIKDCVVPNMMYVFVEIDIDVQHFVSTVKQLIPDRSTKVCCIATIQFVSSMRAAVTALMAPTSTTSMASSSSSGGGDEKDSATAAAGPHFHTPIFVPQNKPLSHGEILGCTSPKVDLKANPCDVVLFLGDGRFHLESFMIANPTITAYQYNPYTKTLSKEGYQHKEMHTLRKEAIEKGKTALSYGIVMGTLGRQGSPRIVDRIINLIESQGKKYVLYLMSEIFPSKLQQISDVDCFIQVACPRLSIDWGYAFDRPLLCPYEAEVALGATDWQDVYPMDHYSRAGGKWAVYTDKS